MLRKLLIFFAALACSTGAVADPSKMRLGIIAFMQPGSIVDKELTKDREPMFYFVLPQHGMTDRREFASHAQLLAFFEGLPASVKGNGLWIKRFAPSTWIPSDTDRVTALTDETKLRKALVFICQPYLKPGESAATWDCEQVSP
jgi:hypothetical protein